MVDCIVLLSGRNSCRALVIVVIMSLDCQLPRAWFTAREPARREPLRRWT